MKGKEPPKSVKELCKSHAEAHGHAEGVSYGSMAARKDKGQALGAQFGYIFGRQEVAGNLNVAALRHQGYKSVERQETSPQP